MNMNLPIGIFLTVFFISVLACEKDGNTDNESQQNYIEYDGISDKLSQAYLDRVENRESESEFVMVLLSENGSVKFKNDGHLDYVNSVGSGIWVELNSVNASDLAIGEYFFELDATDAFTFGFADGGIMVDDGGATFTVRNGKVTIKNNGGSYDIEFELESNIGEMVKGHFKGNADKIAF